MVLVGRPSRIVFPQQRSTYYCTVQLWSSTALPVLVGSPLIWTLIGGENRDQWYNRRRPSAVWQKQSAVPSVCAVIRVRVPLPVPDSFGCGGFRTAFEKKTGEHGGRLHPTRDENHRHAPDYHSCTVVLLRSYY